MREVPFFFPLCLSKRSQQGSHSPPPSSVYPKRKGATTWEKSLVVRTANIITRYRLSAGLLLTSALWFFPLLGGCNLYGLPQTICLAKNKSHIQVQYSWSQKFRKSQGQMKVIWIALGQMIAGCVIEGGLSSYWELILPENMYAKALCQC